MIKPIELELELPMEVANGVLSSTTKVWATLYASYRGDLRRFKELTDECQALIFAQYNYTPPIHFAVREGHAELVKYILSKGAYDPKYRTYPFLDSLESIAEDRGLHEISKMLAHYNNDPGKQKFSGDNGVIEYHRTPLQKEFERAVNKNDLVRTEEILKLHPEFALDKTYFWSEGILMMPAKENHQSMISLLMRYGAKPPTILKWIQAYYFERYDSASYMLENGMDPNTMSWQRVTILHDMAQKADIPKAQLLLDHGASIDPIDEEYQSTPLGMAARWGHVNMVKFLLGRGADPSISGAPWSTPLAWATKKGHHQIAEILNKSNP